MRVARGLLLAVGVLVGLYGAWLLWDRSDTDGLISTGVWLIGGVLLHDVAISAIVIGLGLVATQLLPRAARAPSAVALIIVGPLSLIAFPMIGGFGAKEDNPTLLDRDYTTNWLVLLALTLVLVVAASLLRARSTTAADDPPAED